MISGDEVFVVGRKFPDGKVKLTGDVIAGVVDGVDKGLRTDEPVEQGVFGVGGTLECMGYGTVVVHGGNWNDATGGRWPVVWKQTRKVWYKYS